MKRLKLICESCPVVPAVAFSVGAVPAPVEVVEREVPERANCGVFVRLIASARNRTVTRSPTLKSLVTFRSVEERPGPLQESCRGALP